MKPILQALVVADHVYEDKSGKKIIAGTFNTMGFSKKPPVTEVTLPDGTKQQVLRGGMQSGSPFAYVSLTDVIDGTKLQLQFVNLMKNEVLFGNEIMVNSVDRLSSIEMVFPLPRLPVTEPAPYALELLCEGELLGSWKITGIDMDAKREPPPKAT